MVVCDGHGVQAVAQQPAVTVPHARFSGLLVTVNCRGNAVLDQSRFIRFMKYPGKSSDESRVQCGVEAVPLLAQCRSAFASPAAGPGSSEAGVGLTGPTVARDEPTHAGTCVRGEAPPNRMARQKRCVNLCVCACVLVKVFTPQCSRPIFAVSSFWMDPVLAARLARQCQGKGWRRPKSSRA